MPVYVPAHNDVGQALVDREGVVVEASRLSLKCCDGLLLCERRFGFLIRETDRHARLEASTECELHKALAGRCRTEKRNIRPHELSAVSTLLVNVDVYGMTRDKHAKAN